MRAPESALSNISMHKFDIVVVHVPMNDQAHETRIETRQHTCVSNAYLLMNRVRTVRVLDSHQRHVCLIFREVDGQIPSNAAKSFAKALRAGMVFCNDAVLRVSKA